MTDTQVGPTGSRRLRLTLFEAMLDGARLLVVDLSGVAWVSAAALGTFIQARRAMEERGGTLLLCGGDHRVVRILRATGLAEYFEMHASIHAAMDSQDAYTADRACRDIDADGSSPRPVNSTFLAVLGAAALVIAIATTIFASSPSTRSDRDTAGKTWSGTGSISCSITDVTQQEHTQGG